MNGQIELPKCKHTMPVGAVVVVDSVLPSLRCSFCEVEELRAEVAKLRRAAKYVFDDFDASEVSGHPPSIQLVWELGAGADAKVKADPAPVIPMLAPELPRCNHSGIGMPGCDICDPRPLSKSQAKRIAEQRGGKSSAKQPACLGIHEQAMGPPCPHCEAAPAPEPRCDHPRVGLISPEAWVGDLPSGVTPGMIRAIQANARTAAIEEAKAAIAKEAAERPLNAPLQEYAKGFAEVLEALKTRAGA